MNISKALCISAFMALLLGMSSQPGEYDGFFKIFIFSIAIVLLVVSLNNKNDRRLATSSEVKKTERRWLPISLAIFVASFLFFTIEFHSNAREDASEIEIGYGLKEPVDKKVEVEVGKTSKSKVTAKKIVVIGSLDGYRDMKKVNSMIGE